MGTINPMAEELAGYKVKAPSHLRYSRVRNAAKRCFELAGMFALDHRDASVVHGLVGDAIKHAWVEIDGLVFDGTCKGFFERDGYYEVTKARPVRVFSAEELLSWAIDELRYWGPCPELTAAERRELEKPRAR